MEPKSSMTSPRSTTPMSPMPQTINFDRNQRPDSHGKFVILPHFIKNLKNLK